MPKSRVSGSHGNAHRILVRNSQSVSQRRCSPGTFSQQLRRILIYPAPGPATALDRLLSANTKPSASRYPEVQFLVPGSVAELPCWSSVEEESC